jgi:hypothetical protein
MRVSPSFIRSQGYNLQEYAATHSGQTSPPFSKAASMLAWFVIYPRSEDGRTLTARWQEDDITTEVTAHLGPRGGLSSPGEGQGLQYRRYNQASEEEQAGVIRTNGMAHTTTLTGGEPETVHDQEAADKIYRDLGGAALALTMPLPGYEQRTLE